MLFTLGAIALAVGVVGSLFVTVVLPALPQRHQSTPAQRLASFPPLPEWKMTTTTRPALKRPGIDYAAERTLIRLALAGGMVPGQVAALLRGSPQARRRRVLKVARELARPTVVAQQKVEVATA